MLSAFEPDRRPWYAAATMQCDDGELVRRIAAPTGDRGEAESELCRRFAPRIRLYGLRHLRDEDLARDLVQIVLLALLEAARAARIDEPDRVDRFVLGTCRNTASRIRERRARTRPLEGEIEQAALVFWPDVERIEAAALVPCLAGLDERARAVVQLSFAEDRASAEIAARLGTTAGNVRVLRHRALAALRRCLDGQPERAPDGTEARA